MDANPTETYDFTLKWGTQGSGDGQFNTPYGIAIDSSGDVYVADYLNNRVQKFTIPGVFLIKWGTHGNRGRQFDRPIDVAVDASGNVYVADLYNHRVQKFTSSGVFLTEVGRQRFRGWSSSILMVLELMVQEMYM